MSCANDDYATEVTVPGAIFAGDSMEPVLVGAAGVTNLTGYTCRLEVVGASPAIARDVTDTEGARFVVALTAAETAQLTPKQWTVGVRISGPASWKRSAALLVRIRAAVVNS